MNIPHASFTSLHRLFFRQRSFNPLSLFNVLWGSTYNISILVAGVTPTLTAWLVEETGNLYMSEWYLMVVGVIGVVTGFTVRETANKPLYGDTPAASSLGEVEELLQEHHNGIEQRI